MKPLLVLEHVTAGYGAADCLHEISLEVHPGEIVALIGANGAGKSTTLMTISGLIRPRSGTITFDGRCVNDAPTDQIVRAGICQVPEGRRIFPRLTIEENFRLGAYQRRRLTDIAADAERVFTLFPILRDRRRQLAGTLSGGEQQMLAIARGLLARPKLLLLDEPSLGLAPKLVLQIFETIQNINRAGMTMLLVEQNAYQALRIAHRAYVLETGRVVLHDAAAQLLTNPRVKAAYLGG